MNVLFLLVLFVPLLIYLGDGKWRESLVYCLVIGFAQDPLRKIAPNQPVAYVGLVLVGILLTAVILYNRIGRVSLPQLFSGQQQLITAVNLFLALLVLQTLNSFLGLSSWYHTVIGIGFYSAPLITMWLGFQFGLKPAAIQRFLQIYIGLALFFAFTLLLAYQGYKGPLFSEVTGGVQILVAGVGYVQGYTGFWRSSEVAGWHLATCACFIFILAVQRRKPLPIALGSALVITLMVIATLTGRRKALAMVGAFLAFFSLLIAWRGDPRVRNSVIGGVFGGVALLYLLVSVGGNPIGGGTSGAFLERGLSVWGDLYARLVTFGSASVNIALQASGVLGAGVGAAAQGAASLGQGMQGNFGAGEGGLAKIIFELGAMGFLLLLVTIGLLAQLFLRIVGQLRYAPPSYGLLNLGLLAYLIANVLNFTSASQVYGDPFVLIILGLSAGFILAAPPVIQAHLREQRELAEALTAVSASTLPAPAPPRVSHS
jgi:hypothetical protein